MLYMQESFAYLLETEWRMVSITQIGREMGKIVRNYSDLVKWTQGIWTISGLWPEWKKVMYQEMTRWGVNADKEGTISLWHYVLKGWRKILSWCGVWYQKFTRKSEEVDTVQSDGLTLKRQKKTLPTAFFSRRRKSYWQHKATGLSPAGETRRWIKISQASIWRRTMVRNAMVKARSGSMLFQAVPSHSSHFSAISNLTTKCWWTAEDAKWGVSESTAV